MKRTTPFLHGSNSFSSNSADNVRGSPVQLLSTMTAFFTSLQVNFQRLWPSCSRVAKRSEMTLLWGVEDTERPTLGKELQSGGRPILSPTDDLTLRVQGLEPVTVARRWE